MLPAMRRLVLQTVIGLVAVVQLLVGGDSHVATASTYRGPLAVVRTYLAALNDHKASAVCATFSPQLQAVVRSEEPPEPVTCSRAVETHSSCSYPSRCWASTRIVRVGETTIDSPRQIAAVHLTLEHRYICKDGHRAGTPCEAGVIRLPDIIYLLKHAGRWQIIKPGLVWYASEEPEPQDSSEQIYYPPGDLTTIKRQVTIGAQDFACPPSAVRTSDPSNDVVENESGGPRVDAPWLDIRGLGVARIDPDTVCFTIELAAPPLPDSRYSLYVGNRHEPGVEKLIDVEIDGVGDPHIILGGRGAFLDPRITSSLPNLGLAGNNLKIEASKQPPLTQPELFVIATSESLQSREPLIPHPLIGEDHAPDHGCLDYPTGKLITGTCHLPEP